MGKLTVSYVSGTAEVSLIGQTIGDYFDQTVQQFPQNEAVVSRHQSIRWTYQELQERVALCARGLLALGLEPGDRIGMWSPNYAEWIVIQFATAKAGAIFG